MEHKRHLPSSRPLGQPVLAMLALIHSLLLSITTNTAALESYATTLQSAILTRFK